MTIKELDNYKLHSLIGACSTNDSNNYLLLEIRDITTKRLTCYVRNGHWYILFDTSTGTSITPFGYKICFTEVIPEAFAKDYNKAITYMKFYNNLLQEV